MDKVTLYYLTHMDEKKIMATHWDTSWPSLAFIHTTVGVFGFEIGNHPHLRNVFVGFSSCGSVFSKILLDSVLILM